MSEDKDMITSLYDMFVKNMNQVKNLSEKLNDIKITDHFNELYESNVKCDYNKFSMLAKESTSDELSICLETAKDFNIVKCILENYNITKGIEECYKNAVLHDYINIADYLEIKYLKYIHHLLDESDNNSESEMESENENEEV